MPVRLRWSAILAIFILTAIRPFPAVVSGQETSAKKPDETAPVYTFREIHDRNGIGKFYLGREIARVMSFHGAPWLERPERAQEENLSLLIDSLELKPGMTVVDLGAGSGRISFLMAPRVAPKGKVLAVDIQEEMLAIIEKKTDTNGIKNVLPVKGKVSSTGLPPGTVDLIVMVDVYHELEFPHKMLSDFVRILKPGGRIAWVEYRKEDPEVPIKLVHKMTEAQVKKEAGQKHLGLEYVKTFDKLPQQHVVFYRRPKE